MKHVLRLALLGLASASLINCADGSDDPIVVGDDTQVDRDDGRPLTSPSADSPESIVRGYIRGRVGGAAEQLRQIGASTSRGVTHVRFEQVVDGLRVHGAYVKAALNSRGELLQVIHKVPPVTQVSRKAAVTEASALTTALIEYGYTTIATKTRAVGNTTYFDRGTELYREPTVERVAYLENGQLAQGYLVETWSASNNQLDHTLISRDGRVLHKELRTANDRYNVFPDFPGSPGDGAQTIVEGPGAGNAESPAGWLGTGAQNTILISGNNVRAYLDAQSNNAPDKGGTSVTNGQFLTAANLTATPSTTTNRAVAVQNLFYLNNVLHDRLYRHGFDEAAGNFQNNNFGQGGSGNDAVNAEAQDGSGTDNANFATPPDGSAPRMQMYLWSSSVSSGLVQVAGVNYAAYGSTFGPVLTDTGVTHALALYNDGSSEGTDGTPTDGCQASTSSLANKIAIIDRGSCNFTVKVANAQAAGAKGVLIVNNVAGKAFPPSGTDRRIKIPSAMVSKTDGDVLKAAAGATGKLYKNPAPALQVDSDLDSDIVYHEYGHGLTWRMIGSMSGPMAGAIGEGASDVVALLFNGRDVVASYSAGDAGGIRSNPYSTYTRNYDQWTGSGVHLDGEIYAAAMYRVIQNYLAAGLTYDDAFDDFVEGMNFTPASPKAEDMRDGMIQAATAGGEGADRVCLIWRGFAERGIGVGASGAALPPTASTAVPAECTP